MADIESEFDKLMDEALAKVGNMRSNGLLTSDEACLLKHKIMTRMKTSFDEDEYDDDDDGDRGWQRSSWCGDNG